MKNCGINMGKRVGDFIKNKYVMRGLPGQIDNVHHAVTEKTAFTLVCVYSCGPLSALRKIYQPHCSVSCSIALELIGGSISHSKNHFLL